MKLSKNFKYGATALLLTALFIVVVVVANIFIGIATDSFNLKADMTVDNRYDVSAETEELLKSVENDITIYALASEDEMFAVDTYGPSVTEILKRYQTLSNGKVKVEFIDLVKNPTFLQGFDVGDISQYSLIVKSKATYRLVEFSDLLYWRSYSSENVAGALQPVGLDMERALASAISYCDTGVQRKAAFLTGKGEQIGEKFLTFLNNNNFTVYSMNLATEKLPEDVELVIINSPQKDYSAEEIAQIDEFVNKRYGKLVVSMGVESRGATNLKMYLDELGVTYNDYAVYDSKYALTGDPSAILAVTTKEDLVSRFSQMNTTLILPNSVTMSVRDIAGNNWSRVDLLASTPSTSFAREIDPDRVTENIKYEDGDLTGPFCMASILTKAPVAGSYGDKTYGKILCLASGDALDDTFMNSAQYSNSAFMSVVMSDFFGGGDLSRFKVKPFAESDLTTLETDRNAIFIVLLLIPILLLACGVIIWVRRKNM